MGTLVWDRIRHPSARGVVEQWGGAVYSFAALAAAAPPGWRVRPIVKVGEDLSEAALARLRELPGLDLSPGVRVVPEANSRVELRYEDAAHRREILTGGVPPWSWEELEPLVRPLDALYLNFLSGFEMELETLERLRAAFAGPVYVDLHSLFLGPAVGGPRVPRALPDAERWLRCCDAVQLNQAEMALLLGDPAADPEELLRHGPSLALVTLGGGGVHFAARAPLPPRLRAAGFAAPGGGAERGIVAPATGTLPGDPTGCGDVWGSVACASLLAGYPLRTALERANRAAAAKIRHPSTASLHLAVRDALAG